jgi:hypothetical protein
MRFSLFQAALAVAILGSASLVHALDQTTAQQEAKRLNSRASDDSLESSYGNGLRAVNQFYNLNVPGAISSGMKAYGQYRNSGKLDALKEKNQELAGAMGSGGGASAGKKTGEYVSPYSRLDPGFLREGETGEIAAKIERLSGVSRETLFQGAVALHERSKSISDPGFISWGIKTFRDVVAKAPNKEFRETLQKFGDKAEGMVKSGAAQSVLAQFKEQDSGTGPAQMVADKPEEERSGNAAPAEAPPKEADEPVAASAEEDSPTAFSSRGAMAESSQQRPGFDRIQFDEKDQFIKNLIQAARAPANDASLFEMVSKKIREVNERQGRRAENLVP